MERFRSARINCEPSPWAVIDGMGEFGDELVAWNINDEKSADAIRDFISSFYTVYPQRPAQQGG